MIVGKKREEMWWWNEEVAEAIKRKKRGIRNGGKTGVKRIWRHKGVEEGGETRSSKRYGEWAD